MAVGEDVYCTLLMSDSYLPGAAVLAHSLRDAGTTRKLACLVTLDSLRKSTIIELESLYDYVLPVDRLGNPQPGNLYLMNRPDLLYTFTKVQLWRQTQFRKIVYIDADVVALRAPDELFDIQESFAAAPDVGWPDAFNSGVMALSPHMGDYWSLRTLAASGDSFDGADQGLLNQYYENRPWKRISFAYNCTPSANYQYEPAYRYHKSRISLVHFIGEHKPWLTGRESRGPSPAYTDLITRWWAVYDRHFKASIYDQASGKYTPASKTVQSEVKGEIVHEESDFWTSGFPREVAEQAHAPPGPFKEQSLVDATRFFAPHVVWDGTRAAPPSDTRPEAANFPSQIYEFTTDTQPFHPPAQYPEPPKVTWYEVPKERTRKDEKPKPIFPWEEREIPKPSRKFIEDEPLPEPELELAPSLTSIAEDESPPQMPGTPTIAVGSDDPWNGFGAVNRNAWDEVTGIDAYVRALTAGQKHHGQVQVLQSIGAAGLTSPPTTEQLPNPKDRRESLILTDFPTAIERPSLPVTPAPIRRPNFWGEERDEGGNMQPAEGVPDQADWNPVVQLEKLRRNSLIGPQNLKFPPSKNISKREMPSSSTSIPKEAADESLPTQTSDDGSLHGPVSDVPSAAETTAPVNTTAFSAVRFMTADRPEAAALPASLGAPGGLTFSEPSFSTPSRESEDDEVLSPTERSHIEEL